MLCFRGDGRLQKTQQIESIDQEESEKSSSAFVLSQADIEKALRRGSNFENSKLRIWEIYQTQPDRKLRAKALAKEYAPHGPCGCSHTYLDGSSGWLDHDSKGLTFEHYPDDSDDKGRILRVYQQYFMVSNAARLIIDETLARGGDLHKLNEYAVVQINDTHPSMVIPELIRLLMERGILMDEAIEWCMLYLSLSASSLSRSMGLESHAGDCSQIPV